MVAPGFDFLGTLPCACSWGGVLFFRYLALCHRASHQRTQTAGSKIEYKGDMLFIFVCNHFWSIQKRWKNRRQPKTTPTSAEASAHDKNRCPESGTGEKDKQLASAVCKQRFGYNWCLMVGNVHVASTDSLFVFPHITMWGSNFLLAIRRRPPARPPVRPSVRPSSSRCLLHPTSITLICINRSHWSASINFSLSTPLYQLVSITFICINFSWQARHLLTLCRASGRLPLDAGTPRKRLIKINIKKYAPHSTLYSSHFALYTWHSTLYTAHSTLYTLHFTLYTLHVTLHT